jgi:hypothetical protein
MANWQQDAASGLGAAGSVAGATGLGMPLAFGLGAGAALLKYWGDTEQWKKNKELIDKAYQPLPDNSSQLRTQAAIQAGTTKTTLGRANERQMAAGGLQSSGMAVTAANQAASVASQSLQKENQAIALRELELKKYNAELKLRKAQAEQAAQINPADYIVPAVQVAAGAYQAFNPQAFIPQAPQQGGDQAPQSFQRPKPAINGIDSPLPVAPTFNQPQFGMTSPFIEQPIDQYDPRNFRSTEMAYGGIPVPRWSWNA